MENKIRVMPPDMNRPTFTALLKVLTYLMDDEYKHWLECGSPRSGHIYCELLKLNRWALDVSERLFLEKSALPEADPSRALIGCGGGQRRRPVPGERVGGKLARLNKKGRQATV